eukprot:CAMPEP_0172161806 /NCGR_PEP_ID=MMETSP1050-20130122/6322_1 /TAXON_ID=233186 /ORGANISM="Cryptomonas curvata, Strain CCAP979/52" /LENGTH=379 /DNA_ID=CAMNT_0012831729 /DNA_START=555 /DNA_END=1690 /DNA_ORIENTATION=+
MASPNRSLECRLKSPEKGKVRILVEPIDADTGDVLKLNFSAKDLKIKDRIWRGKGSAFIKIFRRRPHGFLDELVCEAQAVAASSDNELRDPTFRGVDVDFGSAALGTVSSAYRIEVWEDASGTQHFLGQVLHSVEELVRGPHPKSLLITKETDRADAPKARGYLVVVSAEVVYSNHTGRTVLAKLEEISSKSRDIGLGADLARSIAEMEPNRSLLQSSVQSNAALLQRARAFVTSNAAQIIDDHLQRVNKILLSIFGSEDGGEPVRIDAAEAERAFEFFDACRHEEAIRDAVKPMELTFSENMRSYSRSIWLQMEARLVAILEESVMDVTARRQLARELHGRLQEAQDCRTKHPRVYKAMGGKPGFIEEWVERLEEVRS